MDKNNIIIPTSNLEELEREIDAWRKLPHQLRIMSNAACYDKYGCNIEDLYNKIKVAIGNREVSNDYYTNIRMESSILENIVDTDEFLGRDDYRDILSLSKQIQMSPYIIIIDPDDDTEDKLIEKRNSFNLLNNKFRLFSNDYSVQLWGYNVPTMFEKMMSRINADDSDILSSTGNVKVETEAIMPLINKVIHGYTSNDMNLATKYMTEFALNVDTNPFTRSISDKYFGNQTGLTTHPSIPKVVPWFTYSEMVDMGIECNISCDNYYKAVKEAKNDDELLSLGWNPSLQLNNHTLKLARNRQYDWFMRHGGLIYDYFKSYIKESDDLTSLSPIYIIINNPIPYSDDFENTKEYVSGKENFDSVGISFDSNFNNIYILGKDGTYNINSFNFFEIIAVFVPVEDYNKIKEDINNTIHKSYVSIFDFLAKNTDIMDRNKEDFIYASIMDRLYNGYGLRNKYYRLFKGILDNFDVNKVKEIEYIIINGKK